MRGSLSYSILRPSMHLRDAFVLLCASPHLLCTCTACSPHEAALSRLRHAQCPKSSFPPCFLLRLKMEIFFLFSALNKVSAAKETDKIQHKSHEFGAKCEKGTLLSKNVGQNNLSRSFRFTGFTGIDNLPQLQSLIWCFCSCKGSQVSLKMGVEATGTPRHTEE